MPSATNVERTHRTCFSELLTSVKLHAPLISPQIINTPLGVGGQNAQRQHRCWSQLGRWVRTVSRWGRLTAKYLFHIKKYQVTFWSNSILSNAGPCKTRISTAAEHIANTKRFTTVHIMALVRHGMVCSAKNPPPPSSINCFRNWKENI